MKEHLPIPQGGTVLDLGSNNGFNPLADASRRGRIGGWSGDRAASHQQAIFLKSAFEWLDNRAYDFRCIQGSQGDLASFGLPRFDVVTALCSLIISPSSNSRPCPLHPHAHERTRSSMQHRPPDRPWRRGGTHRKASVDFAIEMLEQAGFTAAKNCRSSRLQPAAHHRASARLTSNTTKFKEKTAR